MSIYYDESYSPFLYLKKEKAPTAIKIIQRGGGGKLKPNRPLIERVAIPQQIKTECPNRRSRLDDRSGILLAIKKAAQVRCLIQQLHGQMVGC
jgi:hypothetical protein